MDGNKAAEIFERFLVMLGCADADLSMFDGAFLYNDLSNGKLQIGAVPADVNNKWESVMTLSKDVDDILGTWFLRMRSVHWSEVQYLTKRLTSFTTDKFDCYSMTDTAFVFPKGNVEQHRHVFGHCGEVTRILDDGFEPGNRMVSEGRKTLAKMARFAISHYLFMPSWWVAKIKMDEKRPGISLCTDPTGIKEIWKLRDIPEGKKRRAALLHWVASHWRQERHDPEIETYVRKHLRGSRQCTQGSLIVSIHEAETDTAKCAAMIREREDMKRNGLHQRRRLLARKTKAV